MTPLPHDLAEVSQRPPRRAEVLVAVFIDRNGRVRNVGLTKSLVGAERIEFCGVVYAKETMTRYRGRR